MMSAEAADRWRIIYPLLSDDRPGLLGSLTARAEAEVRAASAAVSAMGRGAPHRARLPHCRRRAGMRSDADLLPSAEVSEPSPEDIYTRGNVIPTGRNGKTARYQISGGGR